MRFDTLALSVTDAVAEIRLCRPDRGNPIDGRFLDELEEAVAAVHDDPAARVVLLTAEGDCFSHGWDLQPGEQPAVPGRLPFRCLETMRQPVIACIQGDAVGAGLELALACDIRLAAEGAMFAIPDVAMGMVPSAGGTQRLPRLAGRGIAMRMVLLGEPLDAQTALACGLVNAVWPPAGLRAAADALAAKIAAQGPLAVQYAKEAVLRGLDMPLDQALRYETDLTVILQTTDDRAEGVRAFLDKRPPRFEGR
jgi:enoyl-CoA hydratase